MRTTKTESKSTSLPPISPGVRRVRCGATVIADFLDAAPDEAATPLTDEERRALIPKHITLRKELNELEQRAVVSATIWAFSGRRRNLLTETFIRGLHRRMFGSVWECAGEYRTTARNLGVEHWDIRVEMRKLVDDASYWLDNKLYSPDEIAIRLHHRLVLIHPFPNGNGRVSRLMADLLVVAQGRDRFTWGSANLIDAGETRNRYIEALRAADNHDIAPLLAFARS